MALSIAVILANVRYQWDRHIWDVEFRMFEPASIIALVVKMSFNFAATFTRASLIFFYFRLVKDSGFETFYWILWGSTVYNFAIGVAFTLLSIFICT